MSSPGDYTGWQRLLAGPPYRRQSFVSQVGRREWATASDENFSTQISGLEAAVERARREAGTEKVWLVCHSAGGRIARLWMGDKPYGGNRCGGYQRVKGVIFLGSPYTTREPWAQRSTSFANQNYPGAFYSGLTYVSVIGKAVQGRRNGTIEQRLAYQSYRALDPDRPEQWGDGVITIASATVPGAHNHVIDNIYHVAVLGRPGYSDPAALKVWGQYLI